MNNPEAERNKVVVGHLSRELAIEKKSWNGKSRREIPLHRGENTKERKRKKVG